MDLRGQDVSGKLEDDGTLLNFESETSENSSDTSFDYSDYYDYFNIQQKRRKRRWVCFCIFLPIFWYIVYCNAMLDVVLLHRWVRSRASKWWFDFVSTWESKHRILSFLKTKIEQLMLHVSTTNVEKQRFYAYMYVWSSKLFFNNKGDVTKGGSKIKRIF